MKRIVVSMTLEEASLVLKALPKTSAIYSVIGNKLRVAFNAVAHKEEAVDYDT